MALPRRSEAQRAEDLKAATEARHQRAQIQRSLKDGDLSVREILAKDSDPIISRMKVVTLIESMPGYGKARAEKMMEELGISPTRRIQGLGSRQREALLKRLDA